MNDPAEDTTDDPECNPRAATRVSRFGVLQAMGWLFVFGLLVIGVIVGAIAYRFLGVTDVPPERIVETLRTGPDVVVAIRDLARLETSNYHVERVIDLRQAQSRFFGLVAAEDALLLVAAADVSAGVDLTKMEDGDIVIDPDGSTATITLPAPEIFSARLDNERTYVHTRNTDALARRDDHLETRARREAERSLEASALEAGILERARDNGETAITALARSLGYDRVTIRWKDRLQETE